MRYRTIVAALATLFALPPPAFAAGAPPDAAPATLEVVREAAAGLAGYTIYRPADLEAGPAKTPVVLWSNGACAASNDAYRDFLTRLAAHGFVVVAHGAPEAKARPGSTASEERLQKALDWVFTPAGEGGPPYAGRLDASKVATAGHSCGGIDALWTASHDDRVAAVVSLNSGCFPDSGSGGLSGPLAVCRQHLGALRGPALFVAGGTSDVAYPNALGSYESVSAVPAAFLSHADAGHGGFFGGVSPVVQGQVVRAVVAWLDGTLNGNEPALDYLAGPRPALGSEPGWTVLSKGFAPPR